MTKAKRKADPAAWELSGNKITSFGHGTIAVIPTLNDGGVFAWLSNARLIVASPELLVACQAALWACEGKEYDPDRFDAAKRLCRAAIRQALGKGK